MRFNFEKCYYGFLFINEFCFYDPSSPKIRFFIKTKTPIKIKTIKEDSRIIIIDIGMLSIANIENGCLNNFSFLNYFSRTFIYKK